MTTTTDTVYCAICHCPIAWLQYPGVKAQWTHIGPTATASQGHTPHPDND